MIEESKTTKTNKSEKILISIISIILGAILLINFNNYKKLENKLAVKEDIRELILTVKAVEIKESIEFNSNDTLDNIKNENGEKLKAIMKYINPEDFNKIKSLTIENAEKIVNNEADFLITKEGEFLSIDKNS